MGETTGISWTQATWNPWHGCHKISQGCKNCYMFRDKARYGQDPNVVVRSKTKFNEPLKWKEPRLIFTCSWSDWFIEEADAWREEAWDIIRRTPQHTYQILTKRIERAVGRIPVPPLPNVWLGVSVESPEQDHRIVRLLNEPAAVRFLSAEPLLAPLDLKRVKTAWYYREFFRQLAIRKGDNPDEVLRRCAIDDTPWIDTLTGEWFDGWDSGGGHQKLDWVIVGGESGPDARPMHPAWARSLRDQCVAANVAFFFKQWGSLIPMSRTDGVQELPFGNYDVATHFGFLKNPAHADGAILDGVRWQQMPQVTRG